MEEGINSLNIVVARSARAATLVLGFSFALAPSLVAAKGQSQPRRLDAFALQRAFARAASEFKVPEDLLLSISYNETRCENHDGAPSTSGGYGLMHLTDVPQAPRADGRGASARSSLLRSRARVAVDLQTLPQAARLIRVNKSQLKKDPVQNIRGAAALLRAYELSALRGLPADLAEWYVAAARYSGSSEETIATDFATQIFNTIRQGINETNSDGQVLHLAAQPVLPVRSEIKAIHLQTDRSSPQAECPKAVFCRFISASANNFSVARRINGGPAVRYIVIHDTEGSYSSAVGTFQDPQRYASANYVLRSSDGQITQMVRDKDVAWHCGNWYMNSHSIGLEHEGIAVQGAKWYSEPMYRASAKLVAYLAAKYHIPLDRAHIVGHEDVPGPSPSAQSEQHWDPGPFWNWAHYMDLLKAPIDAHPSDPTAKIVIIDPDFATNKPPLVHCFSLTDCRPLKSQPANFVYLYTAPRANAPLISDPALHPSGTHGTKLVTDWGDKAVIGQEFYRVASNGDWDAIYYGGKKAWFYDPGQDTNTVAGDGTLLTPRQGLRSIPVYGTAYPDAGAYPAYIPVQHIATLQYRIPAGQIYVAKQLVRSDYFWSESATQHSQVKGNSRYYEIFFNHRVAFLKASDVRVVPQTPPSR